MLFIIGFVIVFASVIGGYTMHHGNVLGLWQPNEFIIITGAAFGAFLIGNPMKVVKDVGKSLKYLMKGSPYRKASYLELLTLLYTVFRTMKTKGMLEMEGHIERPEESALFSQYPGFLRN